MIKSKLLSTLSLSLISCVLWAQSNEIFKKLDQSKGLSNGSVTGIVQDSLGFLWIATKNGINRYDGYSFKVYNTKNSGIGANDISTLFIDRQERLWAGTIGGGLNLYDPKTDDFVSYQSEPGNRCAISSNDIQCIFQDSRGKLWIGTVNGLNKFLESKGEFRSYLADRKNPLAISNSSVMSIYEDGLGFLWIGTFGGGLNKFHREKETFQHFTDSNHDGINPIYVHVLSSLNPESLLVGTSGEGLLEFDLVKERFEPFLAGAISGIQIVRSLFEDSADNLWIGTDGDGLIRISFKDYSPQINQYKNQPNIQTSIASNAVYSIYQDTKENIWIGTAWNGLNVIEKEGSGVDFYYSDFKGAEKTGVLSILKDPEGLWFGTDGYGISHYHEKSKVTTYFNKNWKNDLGGDYIQFIKPGKEKGGYWIGTFKNGLIHYVNDQEVINYRVENQEERFISHNNVRDILQVNEFEYLIGTWGGGLNLLNTSSGKSIVLRNDPMDSTSIGSDNVISLLHAGNNKVWVATFGGGLNLLDLNNREFTRFLHNKQDDHSISGNNVISLLKDEKENLWIGTWGNGLNYFDFQKQTFKRYDSDHGLIHNTITSLLEDGSGNIWISTKQGIAKYNPKDGVFSSFRNLSGEFHINSAFQDKSGKLYFGSSEGVVAFYPNDFENLTTAQPEVIMTGFSVHNKQLPIGGKELESDISIQNEIVLNHNQNVIKIDFAALEFPFSDQCEYAIKLENFTDEWIELGKQRSVTFSNLSPDSYNLKLKAKVSPGAWGEDYTSFKIEILKPWWSLWWAKLFYVAAALFLLYLFQKYIRQWEKMKSNLKLEILHREKETELHNIKEQFFTNISHEIRTPITLILGSIHQLEDRGIADKKQNESLSAIRRYGSHLLHLVNELLDFRKLETNGLKLKVAEGDFSKFVEEVYLSFIDQAEKKGIDYKFRSESKHITAWYDRDQLEKVLYNVLSNSFKYTGTDGKIEVILSQNEENIFVVVQDTGKGISKMNLERIFERFYQSDNAILSKESGFGLGLTIARDIVHLHSGDILVESEKGKGTKISIKFLRGNDHFDPSDIISDFRDSEEVTSYTYKGDYEVRGQLAMDYSGYKVLVVEDNEGIRQYICRILDTEFTVIQAKDGIEALEVIEHEFPDIVVSDVMMPNMDGITLTRKLKSNIKTSHIPVIILTARTSLIFKKEGYETGADEYITKPFNEVLLKTRIKGIIHNRDLFRTKLRNEMLTHPKELAINSPDQQFLEDLIKIIEANSDHDIKADFLARELGMSHSVIYKKLKALTGQSIIEFMRDYKLKKAAMLLTKYEFSVAEACSKVGFSDRKYFSQIFKKKFGLTPSEYAKVNIN